MSLPPQDRLQCDVFASSPEEPIRAVPTLLLAPNQIPLELVMLKESGSPAAEQYRLLAHALEKNQAKQVGLTIAVSSAVDGEGKTLTALNLAFALAESRVQRVLLCDVDFRGGCVTQALGLGNLPGITDVLTGQRPVNEVLRRVEKNLAVLPSGTPMSSPVGLLRSPAWRQLTDSVRGHFHFVVLDCPPLCMAEDMSVIDDVIDNILLVVRAGVSRQEMVRDALARIVPRKLVGFVLNDVVDTGKQYRSYKREP